MYFVIVHFHEWEGERFFLTAGEAVGGVMATTLQETEKGDGNDNVADLHEVF